MLNFAANISTLFKEFEYLERYSAAAKAGFKAVECQFPYAFDADQQKEQLQVNQLKQVLINAPPGNLEKGERGIASLPDREIEFKESIDQALEYALTLECDNIHVMAGLFNKENPYKKHEETFIENIKYAGKEAAQHQRNILIEPINTYDMPGYFLITPAQADSLLEQIDLPNVYLQFDIYHCQLMVGDLDHHIRNYFKYTKHIQIAGVPHRHEPNTGEVNYSYIFSLLEELNYQGWIGCEYFPKGDTLEGLGWLEGLIEG